MSDWREKIRQELERISEIVERKFPEWRGRGDPGQDDLVRVGLGAILADFYSGIERIFEHILAKLGEETPSGGDWHRKLLEQVAQPLGNRPAIISSELRDILGGLSGVSSCVSPHLHGDWP